MTEIKITNYSLDDIHKCYICNIEHEYIITFLEKRRLLVCERCYKMINIFIDQGYEYEDLIEFKSQ